MNPQGIDTIIPARQQFCLSIGVVFVTDRDENAANHILRPGPESLGVALEAPAVRRGE
jgi:hypothetical protein